MTRQELVYDFIQRGLFHPLFVSMGAIKDITYIDKFGLNPLITDATDPEDVWEGGGKYPFSTTADIVSLSSSNAGDNQIIQIIGLDIDGNEVEQEVTLNGQTRVALSTALWRVYRMENIGTTDLAGNVYCYSGTANTAGVPSGGSVTKAIINIGNNQTLMAIYTIPKGKTGFLFRGEVGLVWEGTGVSSTEFATIRYKSRLTGGVFKTKKALSLSTSGNTLYKDPRAFPDMIPELTDIVLEVSEVTDDMGIWGTLDILLVDNSYFESV